MIELILTHATEKKTHVIKNVFIKLHNKVCFIVNSPNEALVIQIGHRRVQI